MLWNGFWRKLWWFLVRDDDDDVANCYGVFNIDRVCMLFVPMENVSSNILNVQWQSKLC